MLSNSPLPLHLTTLYKNNIIKHIHSQQRRPILIQTQRPKFRKNKLRHDRSSSVNIYHTEHILAISPTSHHFHDSTILRPELSHVTSPILHHTRQPTPPHPTLLSVCGTTHASSRATASLIHKGSRRPTKRTAMKLTTSSRSFTTTTARGASPRPRSSLLKRNHHPRRLLSRRRRPTSATSTTASPLTPMQRNMRFQFKRYFGPNRYSLFRGLVDIFSPMRTLFNAVRPLKWKMRRFLPGRVIGYVGLFFQYYIYLYLAILFLERDRQFDTGWISPENANWGYFLRDDWSYVAPRYDVEIYRKRKSYKKMDGNRWRHEEDLLTDRTILPRWRWVAPNRYAIPRGVWPIRKYVVNSPMYVDRKYTGQLMPYRQTKRTKWHRFFYQQKRNARARARALRLRGTTKYEYGGTAHHYFFTKLHDEKRYLKSPSSELPKHSHTLLDAAKY